MARGALHSPPEQLVLRHRHSLTNVLLLGGSASERLRLARAFHRESPLRLGSFVPVDCARQEAALRAALSGWVSAAGPGPTAHGLQSAEHGTLFLDDVDRLGVDSQRLLMTLATSSLGDRWFAESTPRVGRLVCGNAADLATVAAEGRFLPALFDALDKIRVELDVVSRGGAA
ncbi:MAG TPA: sigma 54-interacting transcriptional regulator [Candidatus Limnocylindria bacterium]|nr:sigma 54-interacting transcriptional regulator [Candidatus Limnocylindria bacterium]